MTGNVPFPPLLGELPAFPPAPTQEGRRGRMVALASALARRCFDAMGAWRFAAPAPDARERLWLCFALLQGTEADRALANALLETVPFLYHGARAPGAPDQGGKPFDIFVTNLAVELLVLHGPRLSPAARARLEEWGRAALGDCPGDRQADHQFKGHNDNMPAKAAMGLLLGGAYFGDAGAEAHGLWTLRQLRGLLTRRGAVSEFNSPTYSPVTIAALTEIASHARAEEARELAGACLTRLWAEALAHFHPPTGNLGGPFSRAYTTDSAGHLGSATYLLWQALGDAVLPDPVEELRREPPRLVIHHAGDLFFAVAQFSWYTASLYEPPAFLLDWVRRRAYPFSSRMTAERGEGASWWGRDQWIASEVGLANHQEEDFALGTSDGDWGNQAEEFFLRWRCRAPAAGVADVRTAFVRYLAGDAGPGRIVPSPNGLFRGEADYVADEGRYHTVQHGPVALVSVSPHPRLAGKPLERLRFALVLPEHFGEIDEIDVSDGHVWIRDGRLHLALRPLGAADWGRGEAVTVGREGAYRVVSLSNYAGAPRAFSAAELERTLNGFVAVAGSAAAGPFSRFREEVARGELLDYEFHGARTVRYRLGTTTLGLNYGLASHGVRFATVNGRCAPRPAWEADGMPAGRLPFLGGNPAPEDLDLPHARLDLNEDPGSPWRIFSRGSHPA